MSTTPLLDPKQLSKISDFRLLARVASNGLLAGLHHSLASGHGTEFVQYRNYSPGDDLKFVDWKLYARSDKLYTKSFKQETHTSCYIIIDCSASMAYQGSRSPCSKLHYACMMAATLAYLSIHQGDQVGLLAYSDDIHHWLPPKYSHSQLDLLLQQLSLLQAQGKAQHSEAWESLISRLPGRGIVIFLSDLLEAEHELPSLLRFGQTNKYDCVTLQILDPDEADFPFTKSAIFKDAENQQCITTNPSKVRKHYIQEHKKFQDNLKSKLSHAGVDFYQSFSNDDIALSLAHYLHHRKAIR